MVFLKKKMDDILQNEISKIDESILLFKDPDFSITKKDRKRLLNGFFIFKRRIQDMYIGEKNMRLILKVASHFWKGENGEFYKKMYKDWAKELQVERDYIVKFENEMQHAGDQQMSAGLESEEMRQIDLCDQQNRWINNQSAGLDDQHIDVLVPVFDGLNFVYIIKRIHRSLVL